MSTKKNKHDKKHKSKKSHKNKKSHKDKNPLNKIAEDIIKFLDYDDLIKKKRKELSVVVKEKKKCEQNILDILIKENIDNVTANDKNVIQKLEKEHKGPVKLDMIKSALEDLKKKKIINNEKQLASVSSEIMNLIETKRPIKKTIKIKRIIKK